MVYREGSLENRLAGMNFVSADQLTFDLMKYLMWKSEEMRLAIKAGNVEQYRLAPHPNTCIGFGFCEASTRTRITNDRARQYLDLDMIGFDSREGTSLTKKESLRHTLETLTSSGAETIILRHGLNGAAHWAVESMERRAKRKGGRPIPIINAGDGTHEHPTQLILTRRAILRQNGRLDPQHPLAYSMEGLTFLFAGDLQHSRVANSYIKNFARDGCNFIFVAPEDFQPKDIYLDMIKRAGSSYEQHDEMHGEHIAKADVLSAFRYQLERHKGIQSSDTERARRKTRIMLADLAEYAKDGAKVNHPLPINKEDPEIDPAVDDSPFVGYFEEMEDGVWTRFVEQGICLGVIGEDFEGELWTPPKEGEIYWKPRADYTPKRGDGELSIQQIRSNGTTIDRLPVDSVPEVLQILGLDQRGIIYRGGNVHPKSRRAEAKGILMIEGWEPQEADYVKIGMIGARQEPTEDTQERDKPLTVNRIANGDIVEKTDVFAPEVVVFKGQGSCADEDCVSLDRQKEHAITKVRRLSPGEVYCWYCDTKFPAANLFK